ncbi:MAG: hypothetical protein IJF67_17920 [Clostridia bacterium]|nr:hypothetical protein [Clostridia bacterium]
MTKHTPGSWRLDPRENVSVGDFADAAAEAVRPGFFEGDSAFVTENPPCEPAPMPEVFRFRREGDGWLYGITDDLREVIAVRDGDACIPAIAGAGAITLTTGAVRLLTVGAVRDFSVDGDRVTVRYACTSDGYVRRAETVYTFDETRFSADVCLEVVDLPEPVKSGAIRRTVLTRPSRWDKRVSYDWIYPDNNDFAYRETDALIFGEVYGNKRLVTAVRDEMGSHKIVMRTVSPDAVPLNVAGADISYRCHIDYAVTDDTPDAPYRARFLTRGRAFAAGVAAIDAPDNTTLFEGLTPALNLNVTNLTGAPLTYAVRWELMNYDGECVDAATIYKNVLAPQAEANRNLRPTLAKYGMYYLNLYVTDGADEYRECYPFAMLPPHEWRHRDESPFGICATHAETTGEMRSTAVMLEKLGMSIIRHGNCPDRALFEQFCEAHGLHRWAAGVRYAGSPEESEKLLESVKAREADLDDPRHAYFLMANECDSKAKGNYEKSMELLENRFVPYTFKPVYDFVKEKHPAALGKMIWQSNCHGTTEWLEAFHETGMWDASAIIDIHSYSSPSGPDKVFSNQPVSMFANMYSNEFAVDRWKRLTKRYGDKPMMVGETGYPTPPAFADTKEIDIRTQADFNLRIAVFFLEAGAKDILFYCLYDRTSYFVGTSEWNEMYFGAMYNSDYNGVYMPKPWAAAYANLTRRLDGFRACRYFDKYEESQFGTLRAFEIETDRETFAILWSNAHPLPNTTAEGRVNKVERIPAPAWEDRWEKETRVFDAAGDTVTVADSMGNERTIAAVDGRVTLEIGGSPVYVYGLK